MIFAICFTVISVCVFLYGLFVYNRVVKICNIVNEAWSNITVALQKRHDVVSRLMATVHGSKEFEQLVQTSAAAMRDQNITGVSDAEKQLQHSVQAIIESYPDMKNEVTFRQLFEQLVQLEDEIQGSRLLFNRSVALYRLQLKLFPIGVVATALGYAPIDFFELSPND